MSFLLPKVLSAFEDISLQSILDKIKEKHNLQAAKRVHFDLLDFIWHRNIHLKDV